MNYFYIVQFYQIFCPIWMKFSFLGGLISIMPTKGNNLDIYKAAKF